MATIGTGVQSLVMVEPPTMRGTYYASPAEWVGPSLPSNPVPPERIGLQGEYDYYGLAKRVQARFKDRLGRLAAAKVVIKQRGSAIILRGQVESRQVLEELVALTLATEGATQVELQVELHDMQTKHHSSVQSECFQVA